MSGPPDSPSDPLALIDTWGADLAAAAVVDAAGSRVDHGDTGAVVRVASITKLATALATFVAIEEGAVSLDDPLGPAGSTVAHVLCHASGLDFDGTEVAAPGTRRIYSNAAFDRLGDHVAARSGLPFADYLAEGVLTPLGMGSSELRGSGGQDLWSNVDDLVRLAAELSTPTLVHSSTHEQMIHVQWPELIGVVPGWGQFTPCPWGFGPEIRGEKSPHWTGTRCSPQTYGHFGGAGTLLWIDPQAGLTCIALTDRPFGEWAVEAWPVFSDAVQQRYCSD